MRHEGLHLADVIEAADHIAEFIADNDIDAGCCVSRSPEY